MYTKDVNSIEEPSDIHPCRLPTRTGKTLCQAPRLTDIGRDDLNVTGEKGTEFIKAISAVIVSYVCFACLKNASTCSRPEKLLTLSQLLSHIDADGLYLLKVLNTTSKPALHCEISKLPA